jgi:TolB-like protein
VTQDKFLEINLFGACNIRSCDAGRFEVSGAKHKALFALLATAPFGRRTRSFLQETLWGVACYDTGRQSLRRALADIKAVLGPVFTDVITSTNAEITMDLTRIHFVGHPRQGEFLEGLDIREAGFQQWLSSIRANPTQLEGLFTFSNRGETRSILPVVAVLPFRAVSGEPNDVIVGDWLAEEMCRSLSRSRLLAVISHLSARELARQGLEMSLVRQHLNADYCIFGSVRRSEGEFILDTDFIDVGSGRILWTRQFASPIDKILHATEGGIASVVAAVGAAIADEALTHVADRPVASIDDHRLVIAGVKLMNRATLRELARARLLLEEAARRDPYAPEVHAWLGKWYFLSVFNGWSVNAKEEIQYGLDCTARSLDLSPDNAFCLAIDGLAQSNLVKRLDIAEQRYDSALGINPSESLSLLLRGTLHAFRDEGQQAVELVDQARKRTPIDPFRYFYESLSATAYLSAGRYQEALNFADTSLALNDRHLSTLRAKIIALHNLDRGDELRQAGQQLMRAAPGFTVENYLSEHPAAGSKFGAMAAAALRAANIR